MAELIPIYDLLQTKKGDIKEAHLILFEWCNLRCSFCHQDHESKVGMDVASMLAKADVLINSTKSTDKYIINLTGGELFLDEIPDEFFEAYYQIGLKFYGYYDNVTIVLGTNLVFEKLDRVIFLFDRLALAGNVKIATSYDPAGRFTKDTHLLFMENLSKLQGKVDTVNVVITKQNIERILSGKEKNILEWMCDQFTVYFDHYIPSTDFEIIQPSEDLIGQLYIHLNEFHPNSLPLLSWKENEENVTTCRSTKIINKDGVVSTCWSEAGKEAILDEGLGLIAKHEAEERFLEHYQCFTCEYYQRCGLRCFLHHSFIAGDSKECSIKNMFDLVLA